MDTVYDLWFIRQCEDREDTELNIGVYASEAVAKAAIKSIKYKQGFRDFPDGFQIVPKRLNLTDWQEGFVTKIGPPSKDAAGEVLDLPAWL